MPRRAKVRPDEPGRDKVLEAGRELFAQRGYRETSIAELGERAGISKSVLYHYFGSKAGLYEAILEAETRDLVARVAAAVPTEPGAPRLRAGLDAFLGFLEERRLTWRLLLRDPPADPQLARLHARLDAQRERALRGLLTPPGKDESGNPVIELVAVAIRGFATWWFDHPEMAREQVVDAIMDVVHAGAHRLAGRDG
jgi:AcrR family transcriptional regulator